MAAARNIDDTKLLQLATALQTSLDIDALIGVFSQQLATMVGHQGVQFLNQTLGIDVTIGESGGHRTTYALDVAEASLGELGVFSTEALPASQEKIVQAFVEGLRYPLRNALVYREAVSASARDPLTGVNNRSSFRNVLDREVELSHRHGVPLSLIMLDVDRFKSINDKHGHMVGDRALQAIAECMLSCIRDSDILFRYGGEEFCIALSNTNLAGARKLAERVRRALEILVVRATGVRLHITASFGVAALEEHDDAEQLVEKADHSLYRAKALGRNRIATHEETGARPATDR